MMAFPILRQDDLQVLSFERRHLTERYVSWLNDPEVVAFSEQRHRQHTLESCRKYFEGIQGSSNYFLAIETSRDELGHIGNMGISVDSYNRVADVSILLGEKKAWGLGCASIAWMLVLKELFTHQNIRKVTAGTMAVNQPMLRLMQRSGMQVESIKKAHFLWNGEKVDLIQSALFSASI